MPPRLSNAEIRRIGPPLRATLQKVLLIRINIRET